MKIFILIPCYNEEKYIEKVIDNIIKFAQFYSLDKLDDPNMIKKAIFSILFVGF